MYKFILSLIFIFLFASLGQICAFDKDLYVVSYPNNFAGEALKNNDGLFMLANNIKLVTKKNFLINPKEKRVYIFDVKFTLPDKEVVSLESVNFPLKSINKNYYVDLNSLSNLFGFDILDENDYYLLKQGKELGVPFQKEKPKGIVGLGFSTAKDFSDIRKIDLNSDVNTISFTWFSLEDSFGNFSNNADIGVVDYLHEKGYKVWGLFNNRFNPDLTHKLLENKYSIENAINQIVMYAIVYHLDGVNIDFENFSDLDKTKFNYFVKKLSEKLKKTNILLSVDVTVPDNNSSWSLCYDRKTISELSDYLVLMTYDEFTKGSERAGPTASLFWVEKGLKNTLKEVEPTKVLLGIPFYTREWIEEPSGKIVGVKALDNKDLKGFIEENKLSPQFDKKYGLYHVSFYRYNLKHEVWFDNSETMSNKLELIKKYKLGGFAIWKLESAGDSSWISFSNAFGDKLLINIGGTKNGE
ncbi:glycoside hydrolase family 18 [Thermodesulfobium narugense DSM 14796]|uniref:Glycoside hydrolase family 18 n=2 Tax=Thermodesulfobium narugense TaxID=184064 RepID=M1E670_9BACT|nr:glycoside hydrolase family 18 [Thermodesulfobium narugense DSM 14796]